MMRVRVMEDSLARLRMTAREWRVPGWAEMTSTAALRSGIETVWRREAEAEQREADRSAQLRRLRECA